MKRVFVSLSLMLVVGLTTVLAGDKTDVSEKVKESFKKEFAGAESVKWNDLGDYQMAAFVFDCQRVEAYFNTENGELEGYARYLIFDQLPLAVMRSFNKRFAMDDFISVVEISNTEGTFYRLTMETQNKRYTVKIDTNGNLLRIIKSKK